MSKHPRNTAGKSIKYSMRSLTRQRNQIIENIEYYSYFTADEFFGNTCPVEALKLRLKQIDVLLGSVAQ